MGWDEHTFVILGVRVPPDIFFRKVERTIRQKCNCPATSNSANFCSNCGKRLRETVTKNEPVFRVVGDDDQYVDRVQIGDEVFDMVVIPEDLIDDDNNDRVIGIALLENNTIRRAGGEVYRSAEFVSEDIVVRMRDIFRTNGLHQEVRYHLVVHGG